MDELYGMSPAAGEQPSPEVPSGETRVMAPVEGAAASGAGRRRRTDRNRDSYEEAPAAQEMEVAVPHVEEAPAAPLAMPEELADALSADEAPDQTIRQAPVVREPAAPVQGEGGTTTVPRFQTRYNPPVPGSIPSQGVPRPAALNQQGQQRRPVFMAGEARRPVQAEGYVPARPLGSGRTNAQEQPQRQPVRPTTITPKRPASVPTLDDGDDYEVEGKKSPLLPILIIVLLVAAALVLGLLLIPDDMEGPLGDIKRSVTGLFGDESGEPAQALGFTGEVNKDTAPYQITFQVITNDKVQNVQIVNERGEAMHAAPISDPTPNSIGMLHMLSMTLTDEYEGYIYLQIHDGENWLETEYKQQLSIDDDMKLKISETSSTTLTAGSTAAATASTPLTAGSNTEPTVSPAVAGNDPLQGLQQPFVTLPPAATEVPLWEDVTVTAPAATATPFFVVTATPTMAPTPTPTVPVTAPPAITSTAEPTQEPTPEPTEVPTATPVPTPAPTVKLEAAAGEGASPSLIATQKIYKGTRRVDSYQRDEKSIINMPAGDEYLTMPFGVTTFRGNAFRMNAAVGYLNAPTAMEKVWSVEGGKLEIKAGMRYGFGVYSQPAIVKWTREVRQIMALNEGYREKGSLKEVIIAGQDGKVYFLDLTDGSATRAPIDLGYALRGAPSVHTLGYPVLTFGQFSNKLPNHTAKAMGLYYYNLADNKRLRLVDMLDDRAYNPVGAMDTSALVDRNSNTLVAIGSNGTLYTEKMDLYLSVGAQGNEFTFKDVTDQAALISYTKNQKNSHAAVESSLAMYGSYAFYADMGGILRCVDTTSMTTVWAVNTGDAVRASIALDLDEKTNTLWLYTANTITNRSKNGDVTIRRFNAMTGEEDWTLPVNSVRKYKGQKDATGKEITAGAVASPIIGQHQLSDLVYFTLSSVSADGAKALGREAKQAPSVLIAMEKATGKVVWTHAMDAYSYSSPVAVYTEAGEGWVIQCCSNGTIYLMDGLTGKVVSTLQVAGTIEGSPAVYGDMMVFGTTGKNASFIYGIQLR